MTYLLLTLALFTLAASINAASVALEQRRRWLGRRFGSGAWPAHVALITPAWVLFLVVQNQLGDHLRWPLPGSLRALGWVLLGCAGALFATSAKQLGIRSTLNGYFFEAGSRAPVTKGIYRWLRNPMYDSFWLAFVATALIHVNSVYLVLAAASFLLLNRCEAKIENQPFSAGI